MQLLTVVCVVGGVLPVDYGVKRITCVRRLVVLGDSLGRFSKRQLHARIGGTILDRLEEKRVGLEYLNHLLHEDIFLCVFTSLRLYAKKFVFNLRSLVHKDRSADISVTRASTLSVKLTHTTAISLTSSQMKKYFTLKLEI